MASVLDVMVIDRERLIYHNPTKGSPDNVLSRCCVGPGPVGPTFWTILILGQDGDMSNLVFVSFF
jgi:hypothetical protein